MEERKGEKGEKREGGRGRATGVREVERLQGRRRLERGRGAAGRCQRPSLMDREILLLVVHRLTRKGRERRGKRREEEERGKTTRERGASPPRLGLTISTGKNGEREVGRLEREGEGERRSE